MQKSYRGSFDGRLLYGVVEFRQLSICRSSTVAGLGLAGPVLSKTKRKFFRTMHQILIATKAQWLFYARVSFILAANRTRGYSLSGLQDYFEKTNHLLQRK